MKIKILDCKLLSIDKANKVNKNIREHGRWWWLQSPADYYPNRVAYVDHGGEICTVGIHVDCESGIRPVLHLESNAGKSFRLANLNWINVFDNVYLSEYFIGYDIFDKKSNQYEGSHIQKFIISWFKSQNLKFNTEIELDTLENDILNEYTTAIAKFIHKVNELDSLKVQTEYDSINEFFNSDFQDDIKLDTLVICTAYTKTPLIKLVKNKNCYEFIVDITTEDKDNFSFKSFIETRDQLYQKINQTIEALKQYSKFHNYVIALENCL